MNARTLDVLSTLDPVCAVARMTVQHANLHYSDSPLFVQAGERFTSYCGRLNFGWYIAEQLASRGQRFPMVMLGRDTWVFKAYLMLIDPWKHYDKHVAEAYHIAQFVKGRPDLGTAMRALLISATADAPEVHINKVAQATGVCYASIEAFESLFYNILDRRQDSIYLACEVYPAGRAVEFTDGYMNSATFSELMKRIGYNYRDLQLTTYMVGIGDHTYMAKLASKEGGEGELSRHIAGNGLLLTKANLLNQRSVGLTRATTLLAASRQAGNQVEEPVLAGVATLWSDDFKKAVDFSRDQTARRMRSDAGMMLDADVL